jgi:hypothetical protein
MNMASGTSMTESESEQSKCSNCGGTEFENGYLHHGGVGRFLHFSSSVMRAWFGLPEWRVRPKRCLNCNQLTFFCEPRPPLRFGLRAMLIAITLICVIMGLIVYLSRR